MLRLCELARSQHATTPDRAEDIERLLAGGCGALHVADQDGEIVGVLIAAWDGWRGNMYRLAVHPDHRRQGLALRLVRAGEQHLQRRGARRVTALVAYDVADAGASASRANAEASRPRWRRSLPGRDGPALRPSDNRFAAIAIAIAVTRACGRPSAVRCCPRHYHLVAPGSRAPDAAQVEDHPVRRPSWTPDHDPAARHR
ncbi:MAG: GNAT family N-acetyltransferase [Solirubrobacteraceae bacterium]